MPRILAFDYTNNIFVLVASKNKMKRTFKVKVTSEGKRIDLFLCSQLKNFSRSMIQKQIKSGNIRVNKVKNLKSSYSLKEGDIINADLKLNEAKRLDIKPHKMPLDIVYQDRNLVVVNKKSGLCVHPTSSNSTKTLINGLLYKFKVLKNVGSGVKLGLIHRIDKDTSGLVLVALNNKSLWYYSRQFERRMVEKYYLAVVTGDVRRLFGQNTEKLISNYIGRNPKNRKKMAIVDKKKGRLASTYICFLDFVNDPNLGPISLVLAKPLTGRTHQIRVHLSDLGYPILGDKIYGRTGFKRMMLHAHFLRIKLLSGRSKSFCADIPKVLNELFGKDKLKLIESYEKYSG